jgi:phosphoglycolate phosphatase (TIGR01487 family)
LIHALAVDIDGTLTDQERVVCSSALQALRRLKVPVVLTTGNTHCFTRTATVMLGTPRTFIAENGGVIAYQDEVEILASREACEKAFKELSGIFALNRYDSRYRFTDIALYRDFDLGAVSRYIEEKGLPVEIIDTTFAVHLKERGVDKGTGLKRIAERMGLGLEDFAAIGDSSSDIPMFQLAGFSASVGNSPPELKAASDYVAAAEYGDGFAEIIEHMISEEMFWSISAL